MQNANRTLKYITSFGFLVSLVLLLSPSARAQQEYVGRFDIYGGYTYVGQPSINLGENGFNLQTAIRPSTWLTIGFDYTVASGQNTLLPGMLLPSLQSAVGTQLRQLIAAGVIPANYRLTVPANARTQTFQLGPDFPIRKFKAVTLFVRPNLGALQVVATLHPADPIASAIVSQLVPTERKTDWTYFYGFGGGMEFNVTRHFALRIQADFAHDHFFNDVLGSGNTVRISVGPAFQFGKNVVARK